MTDYVCDVICHRDIFIATTLFVHMPMGAVVIGRTARQHVKQSILHLRHDPYGNSSHYIFISLHHIISGKL